MYLEMTLNASINTVRKFWQDKRVLITGGTAGLGKALALELVDLGAQITVVARGEENLRHMREVSNQIVTVQADIGKIRAIHRISNQAIGQMGGIDVLINNASSLGPIPLKNLLDIECEDLSKVLDVNLLGPFRLIKAVVPYMTFIGGGLIVNISSDAAQNAYPTWGPYSISKAALDHMTAIWRQELQTKDIEMIALDPGDMYTKMHLDAIPGADPENLYKPEIVARDLLLFLSSKKFQQFRYSADEWRGHL